MTNSDHLPQNIDSLFEKGLTLFYEREFDAAMDIFNSLLAREPSFAKARCARGTTYLAKEQFKEAINDYDAALEIDPNYARAIFNRGRAMFELGDIQEAMAEFNRAIELEADAGFYYYRSECFAHLERLDEAATDLDTCIELAPDQASAYFCRGVIFSRQGKCKKAILDFEEAIRRNWHHRDTYVWLAGELTKQGEHERSLVVLERALQKHGDDADLCYRRGCAFYCVDDFESAIRDFDKALRLGIDGEGIIYWRGCALGKLGDFDAAIDDYSNVIASNGQHSDALIARGEAYLETLDVANSIEDFSRAIDLDPKQSRPFVGRGRAWWLKGNEECALIEFDRALELNPKHKEALRLRSQLFVERGDFQRAEADLNTLENVIEKSKQGETMAQRRTRVSLLIANHFESYPLADLTINERQFPFRVRADLQRSVDRLFDQETNIEHLSGVKQRRTYEETSFSDLIFPDSHSPALAVPLQYEEVDIGESEPARCLKNALWLLAKDELKFAVFLSATKIHGTAVGMQFQIAVPKGDAGQRIAHEFFKHLESAVAESESYRGKILSLELSDRYSGMSSGIHVHKLRTVEREQVILPSKTLELLDRNIIQFARQREKLASLGLSTKKGVLFYGPPGTGKTHTIHYLARAMEGHTTLLIAAEQIGLLGEYMTLARLLQPSIVVIEDADLIARERTDMDSICEEVLLNKLLNEMDGLRPDTDVFFILTTNRPEALEAALASRPGRIDQAIEFPLPNDEGRAKLVKLYSKKMEVPAKVVDATVKRTDRVSASFIKELMRRAAQFHIERDGNGTLTESDVDAALKELVFTGGSLNRRLLGMQCNDDE